MRWLAAGLALLCAGCFGGSSNRAPSGRGLPQLEIEFPAESAPGSAQTAVLTVENPGPGDMPSVVVAFARVGNFTPIVDAGAKGRNPAIGAVSPEPHNVSQAGVEYFFGGLAEGEYMEIRFELAIPRDPGPAANSVTVYDGSDVNRIVGTRLETDVGG